MNVRTDQITVFVVRPAGASFEFLQLRRSADEYLGGTWQTIRGAIEPDETAIAAALRELKEETGLAPREFYSLGVVETFFLAAADTIFHSAPFLALVAADAAIALNDEHDAHRWIAAEEAIQTFIWPSEKPLIERMRTDLLPGGPCRELLLIRL